MRITKLFLLAIFLMLIFLIPFLFFGFYEQTQQPTNNDYNRIYIRPDGSVWPSETPIQLIDNIYYFMANITKMIHIQKSNIILDGNGYTLKPISSETRGLPQNHLTNITNVTIRHINSEPCTLTIENSDFCKIIDTNLQVTLKNSSNNLISENYAGSVSLTDSQNNNITKNAYYRVSLTNSHNNKIIKNKLNWITSYALELMNSNNNLFFGNTINKQCHMWLNLQGNSTSNLFVANNITGPHVYSPYIENKQNTFYHNNFYDAFTGKYSSNLNVTANWDNGKTGNYYNNYQGQDNNQDGIGDTPHIINSYTKDNYPLMNPVDIQKQTQASIND